MCVCLWACWWLLHKCVCFCTAADQKKRCRFDEAQTFAFTPILATKGTHKRTDTSVTHTTPPYTCRPVSAHTHSAATAAIARGQLLPLHTHSRPASAAAAPHVLHPSSRPLLPSPPLLSPQTTHTSPPSPVPPPSPRAGLTPPMSNEQALMSALHTRQVRRERGSACVYVSC